MVLSDTWWILCGRICLRHVGNLLNLFIILLITKTLSWHKFAEGQNLQWAQKCSLQCSFTSLVLIKWFIKQHFTAAWLFSILIADDSAPGVVACSEKGFPVFWQLCATKLLHILMNCAPSLVPLLTKMELTRKEFMGKFISSSLFIQLATQDFHIYLGQIVIFRFVGFLLFRYVIDIVIRNAPFQR